MSEVKQIAGRAGRKGMYNQGYVNSLEDREQIGELLYGRYEQAHRHNRSRPTGPPVLPPCVSDSRPLLHAA